MSRKRGISIGFVTLLIFIGGITSLNISRAISEEKLTIDIEKQIIRNLKKDSKLEISQADVRIEKFEDINNMRFILYSFINPMVGYRHTGYATYEIKSNLKFKRSNFGWNNSSFNNSFLNTKEGNLTTSYLIVYGMNKVNEKQVYEYTCGEEKRIEEFSEEYFFKKYPMEENSSVGFSRIN